MSGVSGKRLALCSKDEITTLPMAVVASVEASLLMKGHHTVSAQVGYGHNEMCLWLKVLLNVFLALVIAIGAVFIWIGVTGDLIVIGLIPAYIIIVVWSVTYYFITRRN
jgi:hypothetical protein